MRLRALLLSLSVGLTVHLVLVLILGPYSQDSYRGLVAYRDALEANVAEIRNHQEDLQSDVERLRLDPLMIELEARKLLLYRSNEVPVRFSGETVSHHSPSPGAAVVRQDEPVPDRRPMIRSIAIVAALLCHLALFFLDLRED